MCVTLESVRTLQHKKAQLMEIETEKNTIETGKSPKKLAYEGSPRDLCALNGSHLRE